jgi:uncharacterized protein (DUF1015 family)
MVLVVQRQRIPIRAQEHPEPSVPEFSPFAGVRYDCEAAGAGLDALAAPPYDVVDDELRAALETADEHNSVRLILPRDVARDGDRYEHAADTFARWRASGVLVADIAPRFYAYRMTFVDPHGAKRRTRGVLGALTLPAAGADDVLPHERTLPKAKSDRLSLLRAMRVNVDPIWGLSLASGLTALLASAVPLARCRDIDGAVHELGAIDDPAAVAAISELVASSALVLADGHHRFETACTYRDESDARRDEQRSANTPLGGGADAIMMLVVELADDELCIEPIHRLIDLPTGIDVRARLADAFEIRAAGAVSPDAVDALESAMRREHGLGLIDGHGLALAIPRPAARAAAEAAEHPSVAGTDTAIVEALVVPRLPDATWQYRHDAHAVAALVDKDVASAALLCSPVSVARTRAAALAGARMPQKTTFFWPKPRTGMVFRTLD